MGNCADKMPLPNKLLMESKRKTSNDDPIMLPGSYKVRAKCNYKANGKVNDISFYKNETMNVIWKYNDSWLEVVKENDQRQGLVPSHLVIRIVESPQSIEGWHYVNRQQAKYLLMNSNLECGTYILRPSSKKNCYALSVRDYDYKKSSDIVKNFLIRTIQTDHGEEYLTHVRVYPNISFLINYFKAHGIGLNHTKLTEPIPEFYESTSNFSEPKRNFITQINDDNNNFEFSKFKNSDKINEEIFKKPNSRKSDFVLITKFKIKYQCRKISIFFEKCTKPHNDK